jgi:hypothetical protein
LGTAAATAAASTAASCKPSDAAGHSIWGLLVRAAAGDSSSRPAEGAARWGGGGNQGASTLHKANSRYAGRQVSSHSCMRSSQHAASDVGTRHVQTTAQGGTKSLQNPGPDS